MSNIRVKITVVIPARNESKFLNQTLNALKYQDLQPVRIVIVNGGSTDNTSDIVKSHNVDVIDLSNRGILLQEILFYLMLLIKDLKPFLVLSVIMS